MLVFESGKDGQVKCGISGNPAEITQDLLMCIGAVHDAIKEQDDNLASAVRDIVEECCKHGSDMNKALFEHFKEPKYLADALKDNNRKMIRRKLIELMDEVDKLGDGIDTTEFRKAISGCEGVSDD